MYLLFDIGATHMRLAVSNGTRIGKSVMVKTPDRYQDGLSLLKAMSQALLKDRPAQMAVGGVAGPLDGKAGKIIDFIQKDWNRKPLLTDLKKILGAKTVLVNDAAAAALGEAVYGAGKGKRIVAYLTVSSGIGGARVVDGKIDNNSTGFEPRLQILQAHPLKNFGSLSSGTAIRTIYKKPGESLQDKKAWQEVELWLTMGFNNVVALWSPDVLVVGGPVIFNRHISLARIEKSLSKSLKILPKRPKIRKAILKQKSGLFGALVILKQQLNKKNRR